MRFLLNLGVGFGVILSVLGPFNVILVSVEVFWRPCALQGSPERGRVENVNKNVVRGSTPGPPKSTQNLLKSIRKSRYVCVSASECVFYAQGVAKGGLNMLKPL